MVGVKFLYNIRKLGIKKFFIYFLLTFISILIGFFSSVAISTILGQTGDWAILGSALLSAVVELISKIFYSSRKSHLEVFIYPMNLLMFVNYLKIGLVYGFFVEAFKLGS